MPRAGCKFGALGHVGFGGVGLESRVVRSGLGECKL